MKLPHSHAAVISDAKLADYLLNHVHPDNGGKAAFFQALGFSLNNTATLAAALRQSANETEVAEVAESDKP